MNAFSLISQMIKFAKTDHFTFVFPDVEGKENYRVLLIQFLIGLSREKFFILVCIITHEPGSLDLPGDGDSCGGHCIPGAVWYTLHFPRLRNRHQDS